MTPALAAAAARASSSFHRPGTRSVRESLSLCSTVTASHSASHGVAGQY